MIPILKSLAVAYSERYHNLTKICFLFPNKRSISIFKNYLSDLGYNESNLPKLLTINNFITLAANRQEVTRLEQLFILYNCYQHLLNQEDRTSEDVELDFDSFRGWGETIISDFNTVDQNLISAEEIFKNVKDLRDITSNFLTEEQKEVMLEYFGRTDTGNPSQFWKNFYQESTISQSKQKFLNLWQILIPLYELFTKELENKRKASSGRLYKEAYSNILKKGKNLFKYKKIVIVGFNALNGAERAIFKELHSFEGYEGFDDFTDFIWDATGPVLNNPEVSASKFISYNKKKFPTPKWIKEKLKDTECDNFPQIKIISSPSYTSQVKIAGQILANLAKNNDVNKFENADSVLVLPDESLLSNTLYSLPNEVRNVNLTMGYPFRSTPIASFMNILRRNYKNFKVIKGIPTFFVADLKNFLAHPYTFLILGNKNIAGIMSYINKYHKITISINEIKSIVNSNFQLFEFPDKKSKAEFMFEYLKSILELIQKKIKDDEATKSHISPIDLTYIKTYSDYVSELEKIVIDYKISISPLGVLSNIDKLISSEKIGFEGEPLSGLQIMGTLETRLLDFKNIIVVSMNEGVMPKKSRIKTFIPESLRKAFGLPPSHYSEEIFSYYFFRLISRAENVYLIYDGRNGNGTRGGESRYLLQLKQLVPKEKLNFENWNFVLESSETEIINIEKSPELKEKLQVYTYDGENKKNLSASSLSTYRECQIKFYLKYVLGINPDPQKGDFIDSITVGDILHDVMMKLYVSKGNQGKLLEKPELIDKSLIQNLLNSDDYILKLIRSSVNKIYYQKEGEALNDPLSSTSEMVAENILLQVKQLLEHDLEIAPFNIWGCEIAENQQIELSNGRKVNFRFAIDRLDERIEEGSHRALRIVDYKTGIKKIEAETLDEVINGGYKSEQIFQLFTYAWLLSKKDLAKNRKILTEIYQVPDIILKPNSGIPRIGKHHIKGYNAFSDEDSEDYSKGFSEGIENIINDIFDSPKFTPCSNKSECTSCPFKPFCFKQ